ncbi:hypothetical protein Tco_0581392 [Tanacetum coccineum]
MAHSIAGRSQAPEKLDDTWAWIAIGPERQPDVADGAPAVAEDAPAVDEGDYARLGRLEEDVRVLRRDVGSLRGLVDRSMTDQGRFSIWMMTCMTQLMDASGRTYQAFDGTFRGSSPLAFQRRTRYRYIKNHMKTIKNEQSRTRESEEYKKKPKIQSRI